VIQIHEPLIKEKSSGKPSHFISRQLYNSATW